MRKYELSHKLKHEATHFMRLFGACNGINQDFAERGPGMGISLTAWRPCNQKHNIEPKGKNNLADKNHKNEKNTK